METIKSEYTIKAQEDEFGNKYIEGVLCSESWNELTATKTDDQRRIRLLEDRVAMLESAPAGTQAQTTINKAVIGSVEIKKALLCQEIQ